MEARAKILVSLAVVLVSARSLSGCMERCQMGDARPQCNAYGAPDLRADAAAAEAARDAGAE